MQSTGMKVLLAVLGVGFLGLFAGIGHLAQLGTADAFGAGNGDPISPRGNGTGRRAMGNQAPGLQERDPIPESESTWADVDEAKLKNKARVSQRPGNFEVVKKVGELFEASYAVHPHIPDIAYPFFDESLRIESRADDELREAERDREARQSGQARINKLREENVIIHKLTLCRFAPADATIVNPAELGLTQSDLERFAEVRKVHPEACYLVLVNMSLESLKSDRVSLNKSDSDLILCYVQKAEGWRIVWVDD